MADGLERRTGFSLLFITLPAACSPAPSRAAVSLSVTRRRTICARGPHVPSDCLFRTHLRGFTSHTIILHRAPYPPPAPARTIRLLNLVLSSRECIFFSARFSSLSCDLLFPTTALRLRPSTRDFDLRPRSATPLDSPSHTHHPRGRIPALGSQDRGPTRPHLTPPPLPCDQPGELARLALNPSSSPAGVGRTSTAILLTCS